MSERRDTVIDRMLNEWQADKRDWKKERAFMAEAIHRLMEPHYRERIPLIFDSLIDVFEAVWPGADYWLSEQRVREEREERAS